MSTKKTTERLKQNKQHRAAYVASQISIGVPFQIRALRKQRGWDQKTLATEAGMAQPRISAMEKAGYQSFTLDTLKRLASAFDVGLVVRFAPFSELIRWSDKFSPDDFAVFSFGEELRQVESPSEHVLAFNYLAVTNETAFASKTRESSVSGHPFRSLSSLRSKITEVERTTMPIKLAA